MSIENPTLSAAADLAHFRHFRHFSHFSHFRHSISLVTNDQRLLKIYYLKAIRKNSYEIFSFLCKTKPILFVYRPKTPISRKNKPNSNPIQSQFNPKQTQFKPKQTQFKPNFFRPVSSLKQRQDNMKIPKKGSYSKVRYQSGSSFEVAVSKLISFIFRLSFGLASDIGRLKKRCWGCFHATVAIDISLRRSLICLVALYQIEKIQQFSVVPLHSQCFKKQSSNNGPPSMASKSSSKLTSSGGLAKIYPFFLPVTALTKFALTSCWNILERYSEGIPSALAIVAVVAGNCVLCLTIYINACKAYAEDFLTFIYSTPKSSMFRTIA
jgi:hypothetical protein